MKKILGIIVTVTTLFVIGNNIALADGGFGISNRVNGIHIPETDNPNVDDRALHIITEVAEWILSLLSVVAIIMFMIGGYKVLTAGGDDSKVKSGYKFIKNAIIGLLIIGLTWAIIRLVFRFTGGLVGDHDFNSDAT